MASADGTEPEATKGGRRGSGRRGPSTKTAKPRSQRDRDTRSGRTVAAMLAVAAAVAALYIGWYQPARDNEREAATGSATSTSSTTTSPTSTSTTLSGTTTTSAGGSSTTTTAAGGGGPREAFAIAIIELVAAVYPLDGDGWGCAGRVTVDALGGPDVIADQGLSPSDFATGQVGGRLEASDDAIAEIVAGLPGCGVDMVDLLVIPLGATNGADTVACIEAGLDRALANEALARQLTGDVDAMSPGTELFDEVLSVSDGCGG